MTEGKRGHLFGIRKYFAHGLICSAVLFGGTGLSCDSDTFAAFRQEAVGDIGSGVKTIVNGILDGVIAVLSDTGEDSSS